MQNIGKMLIIAGLVIVVAGIIVWFFGNRFGWFGNLPGDVKVEKDNFKFYAPFASMLIISILLSFILWLINKFFR